MGEARSCKPAGTAPRNHSPSQMLRAGGRWTVFHLFLSEHFPTHRRISLQDGIAQCHNRKFRPSAAKAALILRHLRHD